jgi:acetyltransferase
VILKVVSTDVRVSAVTHARTVYSKGSLTQEYDNLLSNAREDAPGTSITGVTIEKMIENVDFELIVGVRKDRDFGSIIRFGMGGPGAEVVGDFSIGIPPLNQTLARLLIEESKVHRLLRGFRRGKTTDPSELERLIVRFSNLVVDFPEIAEIYVSPVAVANREVHAVNARIVLERQEFDAVTQYPHLVITPYPTRYVNQWLFADGTPVILRPIRPEDEPLEHELLASLSEESMRKRFFSVIKDISHEMLVRFCNIDYDREIAIVAEIREKERKVLIGIGRLIITSDNKSGEYAVLVHDGYHGRGLGYKLVDVLIGIAQDRGLEQIYGEVLAENQTMLAIARKLGFTVEPTQDDVVRVVLTVG